MTDAPHIPVLKDETLGLLKPGPAKRIIDGTFGYGGHSLAMLDAGAEVLGLDLDSVAIRTCRGISSDRHGLKYQQISFRHMDQAVTKAGWTKVDGILLDLGVSSLQLDDPDKGFSYRFNGPLDLRFNQDEGQTAADLLAIMSAQEIAEMLWTYGEEKAGRRIAKAIVAAREEEPIETTWQLREVVEAVLPRGKKTSPALSRVFQALRIVVNKEMSALSEALELLPRLLKPGGCFVVISYHSLEDRMVKKFIDLHKRECICPPQLPICRCDHVRTLKALTKRVVKATPEEEVVNPRSRSARLRAAERV